MGGWRYIDQRLRAANRDREDVRGRSKSIVGRSKRPRGQQKRRGIEIVTPGTRMPEG